MVFFVDAIAFDTESDTVMRPRSEYKCCCRAKLEMPLSLSIRRRFEVPRPLPVLVFSYYGGSG